MVRQGETEAGTDAQILAGRKSGVFWSLEREGWDSETRRRKKLSVEVLEWPLWLQGPTL